MKVLEFRLDSVQIESELLNPSKGYFPVTFTAVKQLSFHSLTVTV